MNKQLTELKAAVSNPEPSQLPRDYQINPTTPSNNCNSDQLELLMKLPKPATPFDLPWQEWKNAGSVSTKEILIVDLVSDLEVDSEPETLVDFGIFPQI